MINNSCKADIASEVNSIFSIENIRKCENYVETMQKRLDEAVANNNKNKIRTIFTILVKRSFAVKVLAVWKITSDNDGKNTAGVDGVKMPQASKEYQNSIRYRLLKEINIKSKPDAIRRTYIPKSNGKQRPLGIPTMKDRINQEILRIALDPIVEYHLDDDSYGFRPKRSCHDAMMMLYLCLNRKDRRRYIVEGDIKSCFDHISHDHILRVLRNWEIPIYAIHIIRKILTSKIVDGNKTLKSTQGTPQGGVISPMLSNVALSTIDYYIRHHTDNIMVRYADDFVILCKSKSIAKQVKTDISKFLYNTMNLTLSEEKTHITHIKDGFNFLGFTFRKYPRRGIINPKDIGDYTLLVTPEKEKIQNVRASIKTAVKKSIVLPQKTLIKLLNPILRGWGNYNKYANSKVIFNKIDYYVYCTLLRWGKRRHNKSMDWIINKYFFENKDVFGNNPSLIKLSDIPILNYVKVKKNVRVYCKDDREYWQKRDERLMSQRFMKYRKSLYKKQKGKCTECSYPLLPTDKLHVHHIIPKAEGGTNSHSNLTLTHAECHRELHSK
ncbi:MAG: group II intron reverse transcriptase/maturase [Candidatus Poribacteria bacterium]|nr:group II intron reverse transcriptase/maturase [Candidatus Poribacteria bacterium]